ncbi:hypothetical protein ASPZODRAFT_67073 [Penicilliopsis zonata CBS 506.65]|uniref:AAA+ ATPase domain-containing protein n=1 Tax=Penicilliopsis zonata CBS 506.65 TaxID=1073090 RepID=A0A1L9SG64_9EURO|nr:hypothetical protein ASPZODRAFT_67073 [Penicilliopsis zonata CBS 506.65]OJJ46179.1 hypothetical protein ASPZODRAFT_67073 [Penicilliopsis zonata CBS 506.65]
MNASGISPPILAPSETALLEAFIPGYPLVSRFLTSYFHVDISSYLPFIVALAALTAAVKYSADACFQLFTEHLVSTAEIRLNDDMYNYLMFWLSRQEFSSRSPRFVASTKLGSEFIWDDDEEEEALEDENEEEDLNVGFDEYWARAISRDKFKRFRFTPAQGRHRFWYKGRLITFTREQDERLSRWAFNAERLYLSCFGRDPSVLKELLAEAQRAFVERDGNRTIIYRGQKNGTSFEWVRCMSRAPRPLSTVVLDSVQKQDFIDDIKEYLHPLTRRWYSNRGIPYRRGYLLHGPPGTGKTSLCFAASGLLGLKIYLLSLNSKSLSEDGLAALFHSLPRRCIVLLEDVDTAGITKKRDSNNTQDKPSDADQDNRNNKEQGPDAEKTPSGGAKNGEDNPSDNNTADGISLSALLNVIDGVAASEGRILVMTTNHIEKLDAALLRPGRVDVSITFGYSDTTAIQDLFRSIYGTLHHDHAASSSSEKKTALYSDAQIEQLASDFASRVPGGEFTPAEIQGYLLKHKNAPEEAIDGAVAWVHDLQEKKGQAESPAT